MSDTKRRLRPSPSLIISIFALVIAMSAGAYAAVIAPKNSVLSSSIKNQNVKSADIKNGAVTKKKVGPTFLADLNDAQKLGGFSLAELIAASGGEYVQATESGTHNIRVLPANRVLLATLNIPHAGKWLVQARMPVQCTYDNSDGNDPDDAETGLDQPWFMAQGAIQIGAGSLTTQNESCEAESGIAIVLAVVWSGSTTVEFSQLVTTTGPQTVKLYGSGAASNVLGVDVVPFQAATAQSSESIIQAVSVQ